MLMMKLYVNSACFLKGNVKDWVHLWLQLSLDILDNAIINCFKGYKMKGLRGSKAKKQDHKLTIEEPMKLYVKRYDIVFSTLMPHQTSLLKKWHNVVIRSLFAALKGLSLNSAFKKKLHIYHPAQEPPKIETYRTAQKIRNEPCDPQSIQRDVRQLLADKVSGNMVGIWLLIPEHLRLGTWDLLRSWTNQDGEQVETRLAMQLCNEAALCVSGIRQKRTLSQKGFELANGLPFVASDEAIHNLLNAHTVSDAQRLQIALGKVRQTFGHFPGRLLAIDPHRIKTYSKRQMVRRKKDSKSTPIKTAQTFFCIDADTKQPICFTTGTSARTVTKATPDLLSLTANILNPIKKKPLVLADNEHYTGELIDWVASQSPFDMLVPIKSKKLIKKQIQNIPPKEFRRHWSGYATTKIQYQMTSTLYGPYYEFIQRKGEHTQDYNYGAFLCTSDRDEVEDLSLNFPDRWHIEEFFMNDQALGWNRTGTMNLNIQYGRMTLPLLAQTAIYMLRQRLGSPINSWDSQHLAKDFFKGLEGDIRVSGDTILVTYYNAPNVELLKTHYENLPAKLEAEGVSPNIPWLYNFKIDFRFK